jgi:AGZA family xanthine/uracil permease-like MFS transporter
VLWIGVVITAQAFQVTPKEHAPAVAVGLFPAIAGWGALIVTVTLAAANITLGDFSVAGKVLAASQSFAAVNFDLEGLVALSQGFMLSCLVWTAISAHLIDRRFSTAAIWALVGGALAFFGFVHAGVLTPSGGQYDIGFATGWRWAVGYGLSAAFFALMHQWVRLQGD